MPRKVRERPPSLSEMRGFFLNMARTFKADNYITVPGFAVVELGLSGNELLCYSLIYGFTQDDDTEFHGSLNYVASALNVTKQNAKRILDRLVDKGLIEKREIFFSGVKFCHYIANRHSGIKIATGGYQNSNGGVAETATGGGIKTATHIDTKDKYQDRDMEIFAVAESDSRHTSKSASLKDTSEGLCLFKNSRYALFENFEREFAAADFQDIDLAYYFHAVADWSSQGGKKRKDWIAVARNFMRGDKDAGKLHTKSKGAGLPPDAIKYLQDMAE